MNFNMSRKVSEHLISEVYPIHLGLTSIEGLNKNVMTTNMDRSKQKWSVTVMNMVSSQNHWSSESDFLCVISPNVTLPDRFDSHYQVLATAKTSKGVLNHTIDLSAPTAYEIDVWSNSRLEFFITELDVETQQHKIVEFSGLLHLLFSKCD